jgi:hypothetical protein
MLDIVPAANITLNRHRFPAKRPDGGCGLFRAFRGTVVVNYKIRSLLGKGIREDSAKAPSRTSNHYDFVLKPSHFLFTPSPRYAADKPFVTVLPDLLIILFSG